jgi:hypothetical protein
LKRNAIIIGKNLHGTTILSVDGVFASEILQFLLSDAVYGEFKLIRDILYQNLRNKEKYCKADVSGKAENRYEMRFTKNGRNDRIYCQEVRKSSIRHIVMCELFEGKKPMKYQKNIVHQWKL